MAGGGEEDGGSGGGGYGASGSSFGAMGLNAAKSILKGYGESASQEFLAGRDRRNAEYGKIRADQLDTQRREELATTLGNIDVIRAASNIDPNSPTTAALEEKQTNIADRQRNIERSNILAQAAEDEMSAAYRQKAAKRSVVGGYLGAVGSFLK